MKSVRYMVIASLLFGFLCVGTYLVAAPYAIAPFANSVLTIALPIIAIVVLYRTVKASWRIFAVGMLTFVISQLFYLPFKNWTLLPLLGNFGLAADTQVGGAPLVVFGVAIALASGVFAETTRYIVYSRFMEKARTWKDGLALGAGYGGAEAIVIGISALLNLLFALTIRNGDLGQLPPGELAGAQEFSALYWSNSWYIYLLPLVKQVSALMLHMSASVLVLQVFTRGGMFWFFSAILLHPLFEVARTLSFAAWGEAPAEVVVLLLGIFTLGAVIQLRDDKAGVELEPIEASPV